MLLPCQEKREWSHSPKKTRYHQQANENQDFLSSEPLLIVTTVILKPKGDCS